MGHVRNITGAHFYGAKGGHVAMGNTFRSNLWPVTIIGDGFGDRPYELLAYADRIWMETPAARFFRNAPALELLDFLERLAPFAAPALILRDPAPRMAPGHAAQPARIYN